MNKNLDQIRKDIDEALKAVSEKHGVNFKMGAMRYTDVNFKTTLEATLIDSSGKDAKAEKEWNRAVLTGLVQRDWRNQPFTWEDGKKFQVVGFDSKKKKNKIVLEEIKTGKRFGCSIRTIETYLTTLINP